MNVNKKMAIQTIYLTHNQMKEVKIMIIQYIHEEYKTHFLFVCE